MFAVHLHGRLANEERRVCLNKNRQIRRTCRDNFDPLKHLTDEEFQKQYRLTKGICQVFIDLLKPFIKERAQKHGIDANTKIMCAIRFFATGSYQKPVGQDFFAAVSQSTISRAVNEVADAITTHLAKDYIKFPNDAERQVIKRQFFAKYGMPGVIGLIDCTHVSILRPPTEVEQVYFAVRKAAHTKNVQIVCDFDLRIRSIYPRFGGSTHDSFVWNGCGLRAMLKDEYTARPGNNNWLLGDSGYGQQPWLFTPIRRADNEKEERYNKAHKSARHPVERCIGVLKSRFRCLCKQRVLMYSPVKVGKIVIACAVLHNIMVTMKHPLPKPTVPAEADDDEVDDDQRPVQGPRQRTRAQHDGNNLRNRIVNSFF